MVEGGGVWWRLVEDIMLQVVETKLFKNYIDNRKGEIPAVANSVLLLKYIAGKKSSHSHKPLT